MMRVGLGWGVAFLLAIAAPPIAQAQITNLMSSGGRLFDFLPDGDMSNGTSDAYDGCYYLTVNALRYSGGAPTISPDGRTLTFPSQTLSGLTVSRVVYVPASGGDFARYLDIVQNPGASAATVDIGISGNLGSDGGTVITATATGDLTFTTADDWLATDDRPDYGDPALGHLIQGPGALVRATTASLVGDNLSWAFRTTIAPGARAIVMTFAIEKGAVDDAGAMADAMSLLMLPDTAIAGADAYLPDVINFEGQAMCAGADGSACSGTTGSPGTCHALRCCTGCWDGMRCRAAGTSNACGVAGVACIDCTDGDPCTDDPCSRTAGTCSHPAAMAGTACDDGLFCTAVDVCDGADRCTGAGAPCDDGNPCTAETCVESTHMCSGHVPLPDGAACTAFPAGVCHAGLCCSGCWDGTACQPGFSAASCGISGAACASCIDGHPCTDDVCASGTCSNPNSSTAQPCNDGLYCTAGDHCDGADHCTSGSGTPCDDGSTCTTDTCDEATHACGHTAAAGGCAIFGSCFAAGDTNVSNRCQVCDPVRNPMGWSPATGMDCGMPSCTGGMLTPAPTCSASAVCTAGARMPCTSGACASATLCAASCTSDAPCGSTGYCDMTTGMCAPRVAAGATCDRSAMCMLGVCSADHHCCATACAGLCDSCNIPGNLGRCLPVPAGTDPDDECAGAEVCLAGLTCGTPGADAGPPPPVDAGRSDMSVVDSSVPVDAGMGSDAHMVTPDAGTMRAGGACCRVAGARGGVGEVVGAVAIALMMTVRRRRR